LHIAQNKRAIVEYIAISRKNFLELFVVAILIALGTNLIAGQFVASAVLSPLVSVLLGAIICLGSVLYLATRLFTKRVEIRNYEAFLIYDQKNNEIIEVPRYKFAEEVCSYMEGAFAENPALKKLWDKEPLGRNPISEEHRGVKSRPKSFQLISEAAEYFVLSRLSTHLTDYFNTQSFQKKNLGKYGREDIPEVLLSNRFLELFSRPRENRPAFVNGTFRQKEDGEVVCAYGPGGAIYEKFDLILPKRSAIRRPNPNNIEIETAKLKMSMSVHFEGFCTVLPKEFEQYYLGLSNSPSVPPYKLNIQLKVSIKLGALLTRTGWEYYRWVDSFLDKMDDEISEETFFERINWEATLTTLQCLNRAHTKAKNTEN